MTYALSGLIETTDYNAIATSNPSIGGQWGVGTGSHGLGQSTSAIATVAVGNTVTASQWTGLIQTINSCLVHQGAAAITPSSVTAGNAITYYSSIATGSAAAYNGSGTTGLSLSFGPAQNSSYTGGWGTTGNRGVYTTNTVTFASGDAARYFFNAGGSLSITFARTGGSATTRNTEWSQLATDCGTINIRWNNTTKTGGAGTVTTILNGTNGGYWNLTASPVTHFKQFDNVASYSNNYIETKVQWSGTLANGGAPVITITSYWINAWTNAFQDGVDGTATQTVVVKSPATTYLTNTWGTPTHNVGSALY